MLPFVDLRHCLFQWKNVVEKSLLILKSYYDVVQGITGWFPAISRVFLKQLGVSKTFRRELNFTLRPWLELWNREWDWRNDFISHSLICLDYFENEMLWKSNHVLIRILICLLHGIIILFYSHSIFISIPMYQMHLKDVLGNKMKPTKLHIICIKKNLKLLSYFILLLYYISVAPGKKWYEVFLEGWQKELLKNQL